MGRAERDGRMSASSQAGRWRHAHVSFCSRSTRAAMQCGRPWYGYRHVRGLLPSMPDQGRADIMFLPHRRVDVPSVRRSAQAQRMTAGSGVVPAHDATMFWRERLLGLFEPGGRRLGRGFADVPEDARGGGGARRHGGETRCLNRQRAP
jgi:hypothetical protein